MRILTHVYLSFLPFSCSFGYFTSYSRIAEKAEQGQIDVVMELGDVIYEVRW